MKRDRTNHKIEYYLEKGKDFLESCYSQNRESFDEKIALLEDPEGYFKRSLKMANSAEKLIITLPDEDFRKGYESQLKKLKCRVYKFSTDCLMMLAGESASNRDIESTSRYVYYAMNSQKYARRYGPAPAIDIKEIDTLERLAKGISKPLPKQNSILGDQAGEILRENFDDELVDTVEKFFSAFFPNGLPKGCKINIKIFDRDDMDYL